jgi:tRNA(Ile)-lysidine synthetase-like protein
LSVTTTVGPGLRRHRGARIGRFPAYASLRLSPCRTRRLLVRPWKAGDRMDPLDMEGSKKLQDIFVDEKVPAESRHRVPVFVSGSEIVWIPGYRVARGREVLSPRAPNLHLTVTPARRPARE